MAKTEGAAEKKGEGGKKAPRKTFKKRGEKRVVHHGFVHIHASFNNTQITITDTEGNVIAWSSAHGSTAGQRPDVLVLAGDAQRSADLTVRSADRHQADDFDLTPGQAGGIGRSTRTSG